MTSRTSTRKALCPEEKGIEVVSKVEFSIISRDITLYLWNSGSHSLVRNAASRVALRNWSAERGEVEIESFVFNAALSSF
jgi:hypothetical protein